MISGTSEEELIVANARGEVLNKCGKDILDILDNQNKEYEKKLENEVKYQNSEVVRLNNIIDELEKFIIKEETKNNKLYKSNITSVRGKYRIEIENCVYDYILDKLNKLKGDNK